MIDRVALDVSSSNNSGASWKTITKGKRSKKPVAKNVNGITKLGDRSPKRVGDFMVSDYDKFNGSITGKLISKGADHIPPKKRHAIQSPSEPQLLRPNDESLLPQPLTPSPHGDSKLQSKGFCGSSALDSRGCVDDINADFTEVVDPKLYNPHDFSGIALLAAAACIDGGIDDDDDDDACHLKVIEELPVPSLSASSEPMKCSVSMERQSFVSGNNVKENTDTKCSSLDNYVALPQSVQQNEDVAMKELEATKFDRRFWDLNVMMDDWQEPVDFSGEEAPSVDVSCCKIEVEKLEVEGCKVSVISGNDSSTSNLRPVNQIEQVKSTLVCSADMVSRGISIIEESSTKHSNDPTPDADKENKFGDNISSNLGSPAIKLHQLSRGFVDEAPAHMLSEDISTLSETAKDINQAISSNSVNIVENIGSVGWERSQYGTKTDSVVIATSGKTSELPDNSGSNSSPVQPNSNDFSASSSSSQSVTCTLKGQFDSIPVPDIVVSGSLAHLVHKEPTSFMDEQCLSNAGEEERATVPTSSPKNVGLLSDIPFSGSAKIGSSLDDCRNSDVSQDGRCYTIGSKDMTGYQDGNDSPYEDGELRMLMPCPWEDNEMDDIDNECVDYESDGRGMDSDGADCPGSEVVEAGSEASLGVEKRSSSFREVSFPVVNVSGSQKSNTEMRYMKEETEKTDIGGIKSTSRSFPKMGQFMRNDHLRRRHSYGHLDEIETAGSYSGEMNLRNKGKFQSYGEGSESLHVAGRTNTGYLPQSNRSHTYSRPIRDFSHDKFMGRKRSTYHEHERNGENDQWGEDWSSRNRLAAGRQGPDGHNYNRPRNMTADSSDKLSGGLNSHDHRQSLHYSSKDLHCELNSRSTYERDDFYNVNRRVSASTNRSRGSSGNHPQGVGRGFRNEYYNPSHENHTSNSSRRPRYLNEHEPSFSPSSGRLTHNSIPRRRSRSRSRSPHPWHLRERNQVGGRRYTRSPDIRPGSRVRTPFDKPSLHGDYPRSLESPPRGRFIPQHNRRWVNDHHHVENLRNMSSPGRMSERPFRLDSTSSAGRFKEDDYLGPRVRPGRFPAAAGTRRGCTFDNYDDRRRDDRADVICRSRHLDANVTGRRFRHDPESSDCQDTEDARNTEVRDVPRSSREDRVSCKE